MAAPDIVINKGQIVLTQTTSGWGIVMDNNDFLFGNVEIVNDLSEQYILNDIVLFDPQGAKMFMYDDTTFYLTTEDKIYFKETTPP